MYHFQLHFEPEHRVLYQEQNGAWLTAPWQDIATASSIKRIQYNTEQLQNYIIIDIDNEDIYKYRKENLPEPNFIIKNKHKAGAHLFYVLDRTIATPYYKKIWKEVFKSFTMLAGGDTLAKGFIAKHLNNNVDFEYIELETKAYNIHDLKRYAVDNTKQTKKIVSRANIERKKVKKNAKEGRNVEIFNKLRIFAYAEIKRSVNNNDFATIVASYANKLNQEYESMLEENELASIIKSVVNYCIVNKTNIKKYKKKERGKMKLDDTLSLKEKQKLSAEYTNAVKSNKVQMKIKIAVIEMKKKNLKINISSVAKYTNINRITVRKYKELLA